MYFEGRSAVGLMVLVSVALYLGSLACWSDIFLIAIVQLSCQHVYLSHDFV